MTNYFENCKTSEELKATYKELAKKYHPDIFGEKGNDILKDVHNQLEKALKNIDKKAYTDLYNSTDKEESEEIRNLKEQIAKDLFNKHKGFAYQYLFFEYWHRNLRPANHRNPLTKHNFSGWNVWQLELKMLLQGYKSSEWSTFNQIRDDKNSVKKGEHGAYITLAIVAKPKDEEDEQKAPKVYYKGYTVFNMEQTQNGAREEQPAQIAEVKAIETKKETKKEPVVICSMHTVDLETGETIHEKDIIADENNQIKTVEIEQTEQKTLNLWDSVAVVA